METKAQINRSKYVKPPTVEQIKEFIGEVGVRVAQFERYYGIPANTVKQVLLGHRNLPCAYWDIIFTKKIPTYGSNGIANNSNYRSGTKNVTKRQPKVSSTVKDKLNALK